MPAKKFRFVSPGVQIKEIDKSKLPALPAAIGPVVIGRTQRGPGMVPVTVRDYEEFVEKFGAPDRGAGSSDVWRRGNTTAPLYAAYAAEAYLRNSNPLTVVRLLGTQHPRAEVSEDGATAGWSQPAAYGLFMVQPSSSVNDGKVTGSLAAVFYGKENLVSLRGFDTDGTYSASAAEGQLIKSVGSSYEFKVNIDSQEVQFNLNKSSPRYIRKVFNTNPTLTNDEITPTTSSYWLGESFETSIKEMLPDCSGSQSGSCLAFISKLSSTALGSVSNMREVEAQPGKSGWVIGQDLNASTSSYSAEKMTKLFRFVASEGLGGDWEQGNIKISIFNIKPSVSEYQKYGTFSVGIRKIEDVDSSPDFVEVFTGCDLDPKSPNYIAAKIGDRHLLWDDDDRRHREMGEYPNLSRYVRVEMNPTIEQGGLDPELLPFGFYGPPRYKKVTVNKDVTGGILGTTKLLHSNAQSITASIEFPSMKMRLSASDGGTLDDTQTYFGVVPNEGLGNPLQKLNEDHLDLARAKPDSTDSYDADNSITENSFVFSLDDLVVTGSTQLGRIAYWKQNSRKEGLSYTSLESGSADWSSGGSTLALADRSYKDLVALGFDKFTLPLFGGTDGLDITEREPFRNSFTEGGNATSNYAVYSLERAIDSVREPEILNMNLLALPGITNRSITKKAIDTCELRGDALAIIDIEGGYQPSTENNEAEDKRLGSVKTTVQKMEQRSLNSSYGCAYYPWVKIVDSESGQPLWVPPSIVALGTMASSQENSEVWFAPAGFNRGGLSLGSSGLSVVAVRDKLTAKQRDDLYERNVNPIASFPSEGIVIFGQKTLQAIPSALDRINVRRLVIFLKKQISIISSNLLFEPNVSQTWDKFKKPVTSLLEQVKAGNGISDYRVVLDETTTTADEIDRNVMYAKLFIKPVYAIEFIGIDFVITNTGASFDDL